jgi:hypothetical protein
MEPSGWHFEDCTFEGVKVGFGGELDFKLQKNGQTETGVLLTTHIGEPGEVCEAHIILELW